MDYIDLASKLYGVQFTKQVETGILYNFNPASAGYVRAYVDKYSFLTCVDVLSFNNTSMSLSFVFREVDFSGALLNFTIAKSTTIAINKDLSLVFSKGVFLPYFNYIRILMDAGAYLSLYIKTISFLE
jgi:hypothetical protein